MSYCFVHNCWDEWSSARSLQTIYWEFWRLPKGRKWSAVHLPRSTVGYIKNFKIWGGCESSIFQDSKFNFDMVLYFGLINCPTVAKIFSCKNRFLSLIYIKLTRDTASQPISLDLLENSTPLWYINNLNFDCFYRF